MHWPTRNDVDLRKRQSATAGRAIHAKYGLFETSFYGVPCDEPKFSLNKAIAARPRSNGPDRPVRFLATPVTSSPPPPR